MTVWTKEKIAKLVKLTAKNISYSEIGRKLGVTTNAAIGKSRRLRISKAPDKFVIKQRKPTPKPRQILPKKSLVKAPTPVAKPSVLPDMLLLPMMELKNHHCRYPIDTDGEMLFCGLPVHKKAFCQGHAKLVYLPPRPPQEHSGRKT